MAFSQYHFKRPNLSYQVVNLENITAFKPKTFDLIYSSNVLEHVPDVLKFILTAAEILKPDGVMVVAVPPIVREVDWIENIANLYHLNIWTPRQWFQVFNQYFACIECYWHGLRPGLPLNFQNTPEQTTINETDFVFKPVSVNTYYHEPSLGVIFVIRKPRAEKKLPPSGQQITVIEKSFTRPLPGQAPILKALEQPVEVKSSLSHWISRAQDITRERGLLAIIPAVIHHIKWMLAHRHVH